MASSLLFFLHFTSHPSLPHSHGFALRSLVIHYTQLTGQTKTKLHSLYFLRFWSTLFFRSPSVSLSAGTASFRFVPIQRGSSSHTSLCCCCLGDLRNHRRISSVQSASRLVHSPRARHSDSSPCCDLLLCSPHSLQTDRNKLFEKPWHAYRGPDSVASPKSHLNAWRSRSDRR